MVGKGRSWLATIVTEEGRLRVAIVMAQGRLWLALMREKVNCA